MFRRYLGSYLTLVVCLFCAGLSTHRFLTVAQAGAEGSFLVPIVGFPQSATDLERIRDEQDRAGMRTHGWSLLSHMTTEQDPPLWESWETKCTLDLSRFCAGLNPGDTPPLPGESPQIGDSSVVNTPRFSTVFYSEDAANAIRTNSLQSGIGLQKLIRDGKDSISPLPRTSIIVKEIWEGFSLGQGAVPVYDPARVQVDSVSASLPPVQQWQNVAHIRLGTDNKPDEKAPCEDRNYDVGSEPIPIQCFYHKELAGRCGKGLRAMPPQAVGTIPSAILPCYVLLVGIQIATREIDNWTWTTFWWTNRPSGVPEHDFQPPGLPIKYRHLVMDTTFGPRSSLGSGSIVPVFNPYLEGPHGTASNCYSCHRAATYVPTCDALDTKTCSQHHTGQTVDGKPEMLTKCAAAAGAARIRENCYLSTGFLWSLATSQDPGSTFPFLLEIKSGKLSSIERAKPKE